MDSPRGSTAAQSNHTSSPTLECSAYHVHYISTSLHNDNARTMPRHKSLPSMNPTMFSTRNPSKRSARSAKRSDSINSLRRSVSGMKRLLPLKLSSSLPTTTWNSPKLPQRTTFGFEVHPGHDSLLKNSHQSSNQRFKAPPPITIRREKYRDTPVYTEPGSPLLSLVYFTDDQMCLSSPPTESCDESSIFDRYASHSSENNDFEDLDEDTPLPEGLSPRTNRHSRSSELSFKCLGEPGRPLFRDEGAWLSSPLSRWNAHKEDPFPQRLADNMPVERDIEGWLSTSETSSICDDANEDLYAFATSLAPSRAKVIDVNTNRLSFTIPLRSSSLAGTRSHSFTSEHGMNSRMALRNSYMNRNSFHRSSFTELSLSQPRLLQDLPDLAMTTPPLSPIQTSSGRRRNPMDLGITLNPNITSEEFRFPRKSDSIPQILSDLNQSTTNFSATSLIPDTPCIAAIRKHLDQSSHSEWDLPAPPLSPFSEGVDWRPRPNRSSRQTKLSLQRTFSSRTSKTVSVTNHDWAQPTHDILETPLPQSHSLDLSEPNLQPLAIIFPNTEYELRLALYAHILAYLFLTSLPDHYTLPQNHILPPSPPYLSPFFTTTPQSLPAKAADRLGIAISADRPRRINVASDAIVWRTSGSDNGVGTLMERLRMGIGFLIVEMGHDANGGVSQGINEALLRALGEIVKGCERECFGVPSV